MKLRIERAALLKSLQHVQSVVERRNTIPILSNVLLDAKAGKLALTATDLDLWMVEHVDATVDQPGGTTVPAQTLYDIVRKLPDGAEVELTSEPDGRLLVRAGRSRFHLPSLDSEDFPLMPEGDLPHKFNLAAADLRRLIEKTRFAISTEETRYYLTGVYLHAAKTDGGTSLRAVATDGHRLARIETALPKGAAQIPGVIVPRKVVAEMYRLIEGRDAEITLSLSESKIRAEFGGAVLTSKLIDGTFPDYQRVIPSGNDKMLEVDAKAFSAAIDRVSTVSTEKSRAVKIALDKGKATLSASSAENASAIEELAVGYDAGAIEIGFNARYLIEILGEIDGESAEFAFADAVSPTIVRDTSDQGALYVLMPMRV
ncbi:MAG: DNA polymerase III subunit beta [Alphaproteobacteria bacterium]|nr:DNA polymerase III subunit beta [Alphaproteobacteria bacterium]